MAITYQTTKLPTLKKGCWRPRIGRTPKGTQQDFNVGKPDTTTKIEALRRIDAIKTLYRNQCEQHGVEHWKPAVLPFARKLASGVQEPLTFNVSDMGKHDENHATEDFMFFRELQRVGVNVSADDPQALQRGETVLRRMFQEEVDRAVARAVSNVRDHYPEIIDEPIVPDDASSVDVTLLHDALTMWQEHIELTGARGADGLLIPNQRKLKRQADALKSAHDNVPVWQIESKPELDKLYTHWRNRPVTQKGHRCSHDHSRHHIAALSSFLDWLDDGPLSWSRPKGKVSRKIVKLPEDNQLDGFGQLGHKLWTVEQLAQLAKRADDQGKLMLGLSINCAFGAAEIGRLTADNFFQGVHPHGELLKVDSTEGDWWCYLMRNKSGVYGEWYVWPEIVPLLKIAIDRAREVGQSRLILSKRDEPLYRDHASNAQTGFNKWFNVLQQPLLSDEFPRLSYGKLRKVLPTILRHEYSEDLASVCLAHGQTGNDDLISNYTTRPFGRLHNAVQELREMFQPFLDVLTPPTRASNRKCDSTPV